MFLNDGKPIYSIRQTITLSGKKLRSDQALYIVGILLLVIAGYAVFNRAVLTNSFGGILIFSAVIFVLILFGITAFTFGYSMRPKRELRSSIEVPSTVESLMELTQVKGIGAKRAEQLKAVGVITVADLSTASAEELAKKLQVSSKITSRWIKDARDLLLGK